MNLAEKNDLGQNPDGKRGVLIKWRHTESTSMGDFDPTAIRNESS